MVQNSLMSDNGGPTDAYNNVIPRCDPINKLLHSTIFFL